ncbi:MAG TPA: aldehyde ferredoxin oxidoreductase family protein [Spirochaetia bacterium]|nr:aldehyde ferredoxin oxidoreductase family protein [Spirochaetia bacterium]
MLKGYCGKILRVDLGKRTSRVEPLPEELIRLLLGGRGIAAKYYWDEIPAGIDELGPKNKIFFFTGPLTGTPLVSTTKFQLATKSPETRMYLCSNCGGDFGPQLKQAGYDGVIIEGVASDWTYLTIKDDVVQFGDARPWKGLNSRRALEVLREAFGEKKCGAMSIGPAGENLVRLSYINVDDRAFGRGGPGAVMGSKKLKGMAVRGTGDITLADAARVAEIRKAAAIDLKTSRANHTKFGTPQYIEPLNTLGCMPTRNFQTAFFEDCDKVDAHAMREQYLEKNYACYRCTVACGKMCVVKEGPFAGARARTEFETVGLLGPDCGISDFGAIVKANEECDELGLDTMSAGNAVALTMELFEKGLISKVDTDGIEARFGNPDALIGIIRLIAERRGIGDLLAEGMYGVKRAKPEWRRFILDVKGMPFAAYDPRGFTGNGLTNGTSNRGACHNVGGWTIRAELQSGKYDRYALEGKGALVKAAQDSRAYVDSIGMCTVVRGAFGFSESPTGDVLEAVTGYPFTPQLMEIAQRIYSLERMILNREGIRRKDDLLPDRITKETIPSGPTQGRILTAEMYDVMLDDYYGLRGWDRDGVVMEETKKKFRLLELAT